MIEHPDHVAARREVNAQHRLERQEYAERLARHAPAERPTRGEAENDGRGFWDGPAPAGNEWIRAIFDDCDGGRPLVARVFSPRPLDLAAPAGIVAPHA